jgi:hypothetical protein
MGQEDYMAENEERDLYFEDAMRIHAICVDHHFSENDARLLTYMHAKASDSGKGIDYFFAPAREDSEALEIMLGQRRGNLRLPAVMSLDEDGREALELIMTIADRIVQLDTVLASECGLENRLTSELRYRLRLYRDDRFRDRMVLVYKTIIEAELPAYDPARVKLSFERYREEKERQEREILQMTGYEIGEFPE